MRLGIKDIKENCIMHSRSQLDPKKSICKVRMVPAATSNVHLGLQQEALE
jgi:hypothetical protein